MTARANSWTTRGRGGGGYHQCSNRQKEAGVWAVHDRCIGGAVFLPLVAHGVSVCRCADRTASTHQRVLLVPYVRAHLLPRVCGYTHEVCLVDLVSRGFGWGPRLSQSLPEHVNHPGPDRHSLVRVCLLGRMRWVGGACSAMWQGRKRMLPLQMWLAPFGGQKAQTTTDCERCRGLSRLSGSPWISEDPKGGIGVCGEGGGGGAQTPSGRSLEPVTGMPGNA